ncbi:von Willebrand factor A domain-containing protein 3B [Scleropages formosus]|uniref:von Willebrand factor A domain-containing protein 3B n=1 Tax=Scleropages formosus TaxID=113540 RepID=UPI0010FAB498|nr:von Willebrand factor A domain-containing protein 3B [Scleropages formosus]
MAGPLLDCGESQGAWAEHEVKALISSTSWLKTHGLKGSRLSFPQILSQIGFRHKEDYVPSLRKSVSSQYAGGLFPQFVKDGAVYNLTASVQQLEELCTRLDLRAELYRHRLAWLTSGSRQLFGVIQERSISLVIDLGGTPWAQFYLGQDSVCRVIREQVSRITWFNLVCCAPSAQAWQEAVVCTSPSHIEDAVQWVRALQPGPSSPALIADALSRATQDPVVQAVYLFAMGDSGGRASDLLRAVKDGRPIHCVSFNAKRKETIQELKELSQLTAGRFHAFVEIPPIEDISRGNHGSEGPPEGSLRPIGGMPPGAGVREDVFLVWREMEEVQVTRAQIEDMLLTIQSPSPRQGPATSMCEDFISSRDWLSRHGLKAQRLLLYDALVDCAFRHSDGVVDVKAKPECGSTMADAESRCKLVNAKYCDRFAHMTWKDGSVVHVYVTAKKCRWYEDMMKQALATLQRRLEWLQMGSRELFGTVLEEKVYFLINTSESMKDRLSLVKSKIHELIQEQLCHKAKVNFVTLSSCVASWRRKVEDVTEESLDSAWNWIQGLEGGGSTHMLEALRLALADTDTQAVYLLTDSLPDQPAESVLAHVQRDPLIPVHTISFYCSDPAAERFLHELSETTGGRYNSYLPRTQDAGQQLPYVSEDVHLLKEEIEQGKSDMEKVFKLRAQCVVLDWYHSKDSKTAEKSCLGRPHSAPQLEGSARHAVGNQDGNRKLLRKTTRQSTQATCDPACTPAGLRDLLSRGGEQALRDWMVPETLSLFQANIEKQNQVLHSLGSAAGEVEQKKERRRRPQLCLDEPTAHWLRTNSLVARRLTMMDILAPVGIPQKAKYVPILDKRIYSKVFDEQVHPFNSTIRGCQQLTLINPLAVDLEGYKTKLKEVLKMYERRLDLMVWRALTPEEKDKLASDKPLVFRENREALLQALERLGWPLTQEDVDLLEDQVRLGLSFLQQASDLQQAIRQKIQEPRPGKGADDTLPAAPKETAVQVLDTLRGQRVIARSEKDGFYYTGTVKRRVKGKRVMIDFISGDCQIIPLRFLITVGGAGPCPPLVIGDSVFVGAEKQGAGNCFVPGVVIATPRRLEPIDKLYTVYKFDGKTVHAMRNKIIKVSQKRYMVTCCCIREQHQKEQARTPEVDLGPQHSYGTTERLEPHEVRETQANRARGRIRRRQQKSFTNQARDAAVLGGRGHAAEIDNVGEEPLRMNTPSPPSSRPATLLLQPKSQVITATPTPPSRQS